MYSGTALAESVGLRLQSIEAQAGGDFPLFAGRDQTRWQCSPGGSWVGGFWAGCWGLEYVFSQQPASAERALFWSRKLKAKLSLESVHSSMIFAFGCQCPLRWCREYAVDDSHWLCQRAASELAVQFDSGLQCIPLGSALGGGDNGKASFSVDSLAAVILLLSGQGDNRLVRLARRHTDVYLKHGFSAGACSSAMLNVDGQWRCQEPGDWSRGQAWGMLGLVVASAQWGAEYKVAAREALEYWLSSRGTGICFNRPADSQSQTDPSACLIAAVAMLLFSRQDTSPQWWESGQKLCQSVMGDETLSGAEHEGIRFTGCYTQLAGGKQGHAETPWGYFFLLLSAALLDGKIDTLW